MTPRDGSRESLWRRLRRNDHLVVSALAAVIGLSAGYGAILFRTAIDAVQRAAYGSGSDHVIALAATLPWWQRLIVPVIGGLVIGLFVHFVLRGRRPQAVADVIEACAVRGGRMRLRDGIAQALASAASIGAGASVGREGPVVHLAATMSSWLGQRVGLGRPQMLTLLGCGVASGVTASFNAPIAGVFFALEVVVGHYGLAAFAPVVVAAVIGTMISRAHFGDYPAFVVPPMEISSYFEMPVFLLLGMICAGIAVLFMAGTMWSTRLAGRVPIPEWTKPALGGIAIGAIAAAYPEIIGVGYETTDRALDTGFGLQLVLILIVAKIAASCISLGAGFSGGVFSPSLCIGALTGSAFGMIVAVASLITRQVIGGSLFTWQLRARGVDLASAQDRAETRAIAVGSLMTDRHKSVDQHTLAAEIREGPCAPPRTTISTSPTRTANWSESSLSSACANSCSIPTPIPPPPPARWRRPISTISSPPIPSITPSICSRPRRRATCRWSTTARRRAWLACSIAKTPSPPTISPCSVNAPRNAAKRERVLSRKIAS